MLINELLRGVICSHANDVAQGMAMLVRLKYLNIDLMDC